MVRGLNQTDCFVEAERDIHVLNSSATSTLAEVVDNRRDLHDVFVAENLDAGVVCVVADCRVQATVEQHRSGFVRQDLHELRSFVMLGEDFSQVLRTDLLRKHVREDGDRHGHTLIVGAKHRIEERDVFESAVLLHFGEVLVGECERVRGGSHDGLRFAGLVAECIFGFVFGDELLAAAGVTGDAVSGEVSALRKDSRCNERMDTKDKSRGVATGVCNALALGNRFALFGRKFRHTVCPSRVYAMSRGGVNDARVRIRAEGGTFHGCCVREAKERHVRFIDHLLAFVHVLAEFWIDLENFQVVTLGKSLENLQASGPCFAIYEYLEHCIVEWLVVSD